MISLNLRIGTRQHRTGRSGDCASETVVWAVDFLFEIKTSFRRKPRTTYSLRMSKGDWVNGNVSLYRRIVRELFKFRRLWKKVLSPNCNNRLENTNQLQVTIDTSNSAGVCLEGSHEFVKFQIKTLSFVGPALATTEKVGISMPEPERGYSQKWR